MSSTEWVVTATEERVMLDPEGEGETTFTVTNPREQDEDAASGEPGLAFGTEDVVLDVVPGDGADRDWFTIDESQQTVAAGATIHCPVKIAVPPDGPSRTFTFQVRIYSADSAPEESSVLSSAVTLEIPPEPAAAPKRRLPWWVLAAAAGLVAVVLVAVGVLVFGGGGEEPVATPPGLAEGEMPDLTGMTEQEALSTLNQLGIPVRPTSYRHEPEQAGTVVAQSIEAGTQVGEQPLYLEIAVELAQPVLTAPTGLLIAPMESTVRVEWTAGPSYQNRWQIQWGWERCTVWERDDRIGLDCRYYPRLDPPVEVDTPAHDIPTFSAADADASIRSRYGGFDEPAVTRSMNTGWVRWQVTPLDDFGNPGPVSEYGLFQMALGLGI